MNGTMLIDAHIHLSLDGKNFHSSREQHREPNRNIIRAVLQKYKSMGILLLRDGGDNLNVSLLAREIAQEEGMILRTPGYAIYKQGMYGSFLGKAVADLTEFNDEFKRLILLKPDHLKIPFTELIAFNEFGKVGNICFTFQELYYMIQSAKDKGLPVMVHANSAEAVQMAVKAGANTIEHGYYLSENEMHMMKEFGTIWIPTFSPLGNLLHNSDTRYASQISIIMKIYESQKENVLKAYQLGVKIAIGSDAGSYSVTHGQGFFDEVLHFIKAGINKEDLLQQAFVNGIEVLRLTEDDLDLVFHTQCS